MDVDDVRRRMQARMEEESKLPWCSGDDVEASLEWRTDQRGGLSGRLVLRNVSGRAGRVGGKPGLRPLDVHGEPLPATCVHTMELRLPGWAVIEPGGRAAAGVGWAGWCGEPASGLVRVSWKEGETTVAVDGPVQPECPQEAQPTNLSSSWFQPVD